MSTKTAHKFTQFQGSNKSVERVYLYMDYFLPLYIFLSGSYKIMMIRDHHCDQGVTALSHLVGPGLIPGRVSFPGEVFSGVFPQP